MGKSTKLARVSLPLLTERVNKRLSQHYHASTISATRNGNGGNSALALVILHEEAAMLQEAADEAKAQSQAPASERVW